MWLPGTAGIGEELGAGELGEMAGVDSLMEGKVWVEKRGGENGR
jgi:hypothetical protein